MTRMSTTVAPFPANPSVRVSEAMKYCVAGTYALCTQSGKPPYCARRIMALEDQNITSLKGTDGVEEAPGAVTAGTCIDADISSFTCSGRCLVFW